MAGVDISLPALCQTTVSTATMLHCTPSRRQVQKPVGREGRSLTLSDRHFTCNEAFIQHSVSHMDWLSLDLC